MASGESRAALLVRTARVYAELSRTELGRRIGVSANTVERIETGRRPASLDELVAVAEACQVPEWFIRQGFEDIPTTANALDYNRRLIEQIHARTELMQEAMRAMQERRIADYPATLIGMLLEESVIKRDPNGGGYRFTAKAQRLLDEINDAGGDG
jgi:transcriptional regulator with XRE-family HTH domain